MYLMYVDESGDSGIANSPTSHFALSGLIIHEARWREVVSAIVNFRRVLLAVYGLPLRTEIHASHFIRHPPVDGMARHIRLAILRNLIDELAKLDALSIINVVICKTDKPDDDDVFAKAWRTLFQRFENTLRHGNFPGAHKADFGMVLTDATDGRKLTRLMRRMTVHNPVPNRFWPGHRNMPLLRIIEDPHPKDSSDSYLIQACDTCAYFALQSFAPNAFIRRVGAQNYIARLKPVLNMYASTTHPLGIVVL